MRGTVLIGPKVPGNNEFLNRGKSANTESELSLWKGSLSYSEELLRSRFSSLVVLDVRTGLRTLIKLTVGSTPLYSLPHYQRINGSAMHDPNSLYLQILFL